MSLGRLQHRTSQLSGAQAVTVRLVGVVRWWRLGFSHLPTLAGSFPRYLLASVLLLLLDS
jgi:hypothetical protein